MVTDDPTVHERVLRETLRLAAEMPFDRSPPWMGMQIHQALRKITGNDDPYRQAKRKANEMALALYPELKQRVRGAPDAFAAAVHLAIAGNVIDLGCKSQLSDEEVYHAIDNALHEPMNRQAIDDLHKAVVSAKTILYLTDNAGEIVLDRLLIEQLPMERVTVAVRGRPIINDATYEDAQAAGLTDLVEVIDNGSDVPGTILDLCSQDFRDRFHSAGLVIAKGQGNYETLSEKGRNIYFLLKAKCLVIARDIGCPVGQTVVLHSGTVREAASKLSL